ncbi:MAG: beta-ketoacyl synthase N-terminal-like domain-containing protein [Myxococcota bacterium]
MRPVSVIASAAISALGRGVAATHVGDVGGQAPLGFTFDAGLPLGRVADTDLVVDARERADRLLATAARDLAAALSAIDSGWRSKRIFVCIGTSAGAMQSMQQAFAQREQQGDVEAELARHANYFAPLAALFSELELSRDAVHCVQVLAACASSTMAIGLACRSLESGDCDLAIAGGYDALSDFVVTGFDALGALTRRVPQPFRQERDGLALGEGAALLALVRAPSANTEVGRVLGFGSSCDAVHITAPDREARGIERATLAALRDAGLEASSIGLVSAHATATPFNDAAEAKALRRIFSRLPSLHAWKASIGHTLGAAGALESLAAWDALNRGMLPALGGDGTPDTGLESELAERVRPGDAKHALKLSAAFGGVNAALVLGKRGSVNEGVAGERFDVVLEVLGDWVHDAAPGLLAELAPQAIPLTARADSLSELCLAALARIVQARPLPSTTAVIVGTGVATLEANEQFDRRRRAGLSVLPRAFPPTSPNLCAGVCSIVFGLTGPSFSVGASLRGAALEAFTVAELLLGAGDIPAAVVIVAEDAGPAARALLRAAGHEPLPRRARAALLLPKGSRAAKTADSAAERAQIWAGLAVAEP